MCETIGTSYLLLSPTTDYSILAQRKHFRYVQFTRILQSKKLPVGMFCVVILKVKHVNLGDQSHVLTGLHSMLIDDKLLFISTDRAEMARHKSILQVWQEDIERVNKSVNSSYKALILEFQIRAANVLANLNECVCKKMFRGKTSNILWSMKNVEQQHFLRKSQNYFKLDRILEYSNFGLGSEFYHHLLQWW